MGGCSHGCTLPWCHSPCFYRSVSPLTTSCSSRHHHAGRGRVPDRGSCQASRPIAVPVSGNTDWLCGRDSGRPCTVTDRSPSHDSARHFHASASLVSPFSLTPSGCHTAEGRQKHSSTRTAASRRSRDWSTTLCNPVSSSACSAGRGFAMEGQPKNWQCPKASAGVGQDGHTLER